MTGFSGLDLQSKQRNRSGTKNETKIETIPAPIDTQLNVETAQNCPLTLRTLSYYTLPIPVQVPSIESGTPDIVKALMKAVDRFAKTWLRQQINASDGYNLAVEGKGLGIVRTSRASRGCAVYVHCE